MSEGFDPTIRAIHGDDPLAWDVIPTAPEDPNEPGEETVLFRRATGGSASACGSARPRRARWSRRITRSR
jgi:hypothetical protein